MLKLAFWAAGIVACFSVAWASRDNRIADHDRRLGEVDQRFAAVDAKFEQHNRDMLEVKTGLATLLERTKDMGRP